MRPLRPLLIALALGAWASPAHAFRLPAEPLPPVAGNPAHALAHLPPDPVAYDRASRCDPRAKPGVVRFAQWLDRGPRGAFWGSYRCERWGKGQASLHAENRAVDWGMNVFNAGDRASARVLIHLLLAPDTLGTPHALARRMGVEEIIWDCSYWGAGMAQFARYRPCFGKDGTPRKRVDVTTAHRDHIHFGLTNAGAAGRTSFWRGR